jgi:hypothetical protein
MRHRGLFLASAALLAAARALHAQGQAAAQPTPLAVGATAPDFALTGATQYGILRDPVRLSSFRGKTVVLAFFFKARTKG